MGVMKYSVENVNSQTLELKLKGAMVYPDILNSKYALFSFVCEDTQTIVINCEKLTHLDDVGMHVLFALKDYAMQTGCKTYLTCFPPTLQTSKQWDKLSGSFHIAQNADEIFNPANSEKHRGEHSNANT